MKTNIHSPDIVILGGSTDEISQLLAYIPPSYTTDTLPLDAPLTERNYRPPPAMVFILPDAAPDLAMALLQHIRQNTTGTPVIFAAPNPEKEYIIQAFRQGATDFLLFPLPPEIFQTTFQNHIRPRTSRFRPVWQKWKAALNQRLRRSNPEFTRHWPGSPLSIPAELIVPPGPAAELHRHEVEVQLLGPLRIVIRGILQPNLPGEKVNALLGYFLYHHRKPVHREKLLAKFWGYTDNASARNSLNVATHSIRRHLHSSFPKNDFLQYDDGHYFIKPELDILTDTDQFLFFWKEGRSLEKNYGLEKALPYYQRAALTYKGDFLEDVHYEEWCDIERDNLQEKYLQLFDRIGAYYLRQKNYAMATGIFKKMLTKDICLEAVHRKLILCYYQLGERDKAIKQYLKCEEALRRELQVEPSHLTRELLHLIKTESKLPDLLG